MYNHTGDLKYETKYEIMNVNIRSQVLLQIEVHDNNLDRSQIQLEIPFWTKMKEKISDILLIIDFLFTLQRISTGVDIFFSDIFSRCCSKTLPR